MSEARRWELKVTLRLRGGLMVTLKQHCYPCRHSEGKRPSTPLGQPNPSKSSGGGCVGGTGLLLDQVYCSLADDSW